MKNFLAILAVTFILSACGGSNGGGGNSGGGWDADTDDISDSVVIDIRNDDLLYAKQDFVITFGSSAVACILDNGQDIAEYVINAQSPYTAKAACYRNYSEMICTYSGLPSRRIQLFEDYDYTDEYGMEMTTSCVFENGNIVEKNWILKWKKDVDIDDIQISPFVGEISSSRSELRAQILHLRGQETSVQKCELTDINKQSYIPLKNNFSPESVFYQYCKKEGNYMVCDSGSLPLVETEPGNETMDIITACTLYDGRIIEKIGQIYW